MSDDLNKNGNLISVDANLIERFPLPVILIGEDRMLVAANQKSCEIFGGFEEGKDLSTMIRSPDLLDAVGMALSDGNTIECDIVLKGRHHRSFKVGVSPYEEKDKKGVFILLHETTLASEVERFRSAFVADVSHELRSPLTTLIATIETLKGKAGDDVDVRNRFVELMGHEAGRMLGIVNDLLNLSTTEAQEHILPNSIVTLTPILNDISKVLSSKAIEHGMQINLEVEANLPNTKGDKDELYQVVHNLVDNAIKYGERDTDISIKAISDGSNIIISVNNHGNVIKDEHIPRLTERFFRVDKSRSRELGGTGLGLAIAKHIINRHVGELSISSNEKDGTTFTVSLPIA